MDWPSFVNLIQAIAWPATLLIVVFSFRDSIKTRLASLRHLKYKDAEAYFGLEDKAAERTITAPSSASVDKTPAQATPPSPAAPRIPLEIVTLAEQSPPAAIIQTWRQLGEAVMKALSRNRVTIPSTAAEEIESALVKNNLLSNEGVAALKALRQTHATVVNSIKAPTPGYALEYYVRTAPLIRVLNSSRTRT